MRLVLVVTSLCVCACGNGATGGGGIQVTASGETLALGGYAFPPAASGDTAFVDGWEVTFEKLLVVFDKVTLSENPDTSAGDQSLTGKLVAELDGPFAVDLHQGGPLEGKGGDGEEAIFVGAIDSENQNGGTSFDPTQQYAFGYSSVPAVASAQLISIDATDSDWLEMIAKGWNVLYVGTATYKGTDCTTTNPSWVSTLPTVVSFRFGFATPTTYLNCQNPDNDPALPLGAEEHQRGIQVKDNATTIAQVTFHTDHPFWESFAHDTPAHFDQLAAQAKQQTDGTYLVTLDDAAGVDYTAFVDNAGNALPWRACDPSYVPPNTSPVMGFDSLGLSYDPAGDPSQHMRDYADYLRYDQSTQGHLNSDGLCYVDRHYPSPL